MTRYFLRKTILFFFSIFLVATLTFWLMHAIPGDPFTQDKAIPDEIMQALNKHYGLDRSVFLQYIDYLKGLLTLDLGPSFKYQGRTVNQIIAEGFPISFCLGAEALILSISFGVIFGSIAALYHQKWQDKALMIIAVLGISIPSFIVATCVQYFFAMKLDLLPVARWGSFSHTILPALALSAMPTAIVARLMRSSMIEVLQQDYIITARAKGLSPVEILIRHVLRNAMMPVLTYLCPLSAAIFTGSFAVEKIFGIPGLGQWFVLSITNRDYTVIMGTTIFYSALLMLSTFIVDLLYSIVDPRVRIGRRELYDK